LQHPIYDHSLLPHFYAYHDPKQADQAEILRFLLMASPEEVDGALEELMNKELEGYYYERLIRR
jgi:hypothetical protein